MRQLAFKYLPIALGLALIAAVGVVEPGAARMLSIAGAIGIALLGLFAWVIARALPDQTKLEPTDEAIDGELAELRDQLLAIGFQQIDRPLRVGISPPALLIGFVHATEPIYATAFRAGGRVTSFDLVSILDDRRGGLTSGPKIAGTTLPAGPGAFRQVLVDGSPAAMLTHHRAALAFLTSQGLPARAHDASTFDADIRAALQSQHDGFVAAPFLYAAVALKRQFAPAMGYTRPLDKQPGIARQIAQAKAHTQLPVARVRDRVS